MSHVPVRRPELRANAWRSPVAQSSATALVNRGHRHLSDLLLWSRALCQHFLRHEWLLRGSTW